MKDPVSLRELNLGDEERMFQILSQKIVVQHTLFPLFTRDQTRDYLKKCIEEQSKDERKFLNLAIGLSESNLMVGLCGLVMNHTKQDAEVWYLLDPLFWHKGFAPNAVRHILERGFNSYHLHRIWATCLPENPASSRVLEKLGFRKEGFLKKYLKIHGVWKDCFLYAILYQEWQAQKHMDKYDE
jgi:RimJ/RimL family protein N-acetyltransferase